jgi:SAM-dependent methyltransferase
MGRTNDYANQITVDEAYGLPAGRWWRRPGDRPVVFETVLRKLRKMTGGRLLDVGCGQGHFMRRAARHYDVYGIDISPARVERARSQSGLQTAEVGSATSLAFPDAHFDVVCALDVVEHLETPEQFFAEAARVLRPGGILLFSTPNPDSLGHRLKGDASFMYTDPTHVSLLERADWRRRLVAAGFAVVRDGTDVPWDPPYVKFVSARAQRYVFLALAQLLFLFDVIFPWRFGENYWCLASAGEDASRSRRG